MIERDSMNAENQADFILHCPAEAPLLYVLRRFVNGVVQEMGFAEEDALKIVMAVDEACSNIARHAYDQSATQSNRIELRLSLEGGILTIQILDRGCGGQAGPFRGADSLEEYRQLGRQEYCGLGILIMKEFMDEVLIQAHPPAGTRVTMRRRLHSAPAG